MCDRHALGGTFKESFITEGLDGTMDSVKQRFINKLSNEILNSDKKYLSFLLYY